MKPEMVEVWHPESPGSRVVVRRRWRKNRPFATLTETIKYNDWCLAMRHSRVRRVR